MEQIMQHVRELTQSRKFLVIFVFLSSFWACSSEPPMKTAPLSAETVADFPRMAVGDSWVTDTGEGIKSHKVIDVKADGSFIIELQNKDKGLTLHMYFDSNYRLTKQINIKTGVTMRTPSPPAQSLNFPLFAGKKWKDEYQAMGLDHKLKTFENTYEVVAIEMVSTAAGSIKAFKIHRNYHAIGYKKDFDIYYWYSPDLKIIVKLQDSQDRLTPSGYPLHVELLSYQKASANKEPQQAAMAQVPTRNKDHTIAIQNERVLPSKKESPGKIGNIVGARWAVLIGISQYKDTRIPPLRYAAEDARSFYAWLISPQGGKYAPSMVKLLTDKDATGAHMKQALFEWLTQAIEEDTVTIYFAGHGSPQSPDHPENLFLLPYDTEYDSVSTTGFPMWDIETALKRFIKAKKVIVITDACHAGGVGNAFDVARRSARGITVVPLSSSLQNLAKISEGVCIISASDDNQLSQEGGQWGGGHGVFTFKLLEGLKGGADYNGDGTITLGELIPFLSEQVRRETRNAQTPTIAGRFDPALSIGK